MKILLTGASGFIGTHVLKNLQQSNEELFISVLTRDSKRFESNSKCSNITIYEYDLEEQSSTNLYDEFGRPDVVIHLAWDGLPNYNDLIHINKNLISSYMFIENMVKHGLPQVVVTGTCFEYGMVDGCLKESMLTQPDNAYGLAKDSLCKFLQVLQKQHNFTLQWVRLFYMYGEGQSEKSLFSQLELAVKNKEKVFNMSKGEQLRDFLPITQVASNIISIALQKRVEGIINCCSGQPVSVRTFVEEYLNSRQSKIKLNLGYYPYPTYEPMSFWGDNTKLKTLLH